MRICGMKGLAFMLERPDFITARELLLDRTGVTGTEEVRLSGSAGRVLAQEIRAAEDVPGFDRSPYDGYAFRAQDSRGADAFHPVTLSVVDMIAAGDVPHADITIGTAARIMTGAPVPAGADPIVPYEVTKFSDTEVQIFHEAAEGQNIVRRGEDVRKGELLAAPGIRIDAGLSGVMAAQGVFRPQVYKRPVVGIISTGSELIDEGQSLTRGKIYNSNRYTLEAACASLGCNPVYLGTGRDSAEEIAQLISEGIYGPSSCDAVLLSGGVSAGDFDLTPDAMKIAGAEILIKGLDCKPGMAGAYGVIENDEKPIPVLAFSGNPAACMTAFWLVGAPVLRKLSGLQEPRLKKVDCTLLTGFSKRSKGTRVLRGRLIYREGKACLSSSDRQGNSVLSTAIGTDLMAVIPAGSGPLEAGSVLRGYLITD